LEYLPVGLFASVVGLSGMSVAWRLATKHYGAPYWISQSWGISAIVMFVAVSCGYFIKLISAPDAVSAEFRHPILGNLFGTVPLSMLLLPMVIYPVSLGFARALWCMGAIVMLTFSWFRIYRWMSDRQQVAHATPAWFIPVVGLLDVPLALPSLAMPNSHGIMTACLAIGFFFALPLFTIIFARLLFEAPMPDALQPTLLILVAPFSVGFSTYVATTHRFDLFTQSLYALNIFLLSILLGRLRLIGRCCPFRVSWWAVAFPLAASTSSAIQFAASKSTLILDVIAVTLLALSSCVILGLLLRTLIGAARGELRVLSE
jgi:tellurite resistance protein